MNVKSIAIPSKTIRVRMLVMKLQAERRDPVAHCFHAGCDAPVYCSFGTKIARELYLHGHPVFACNEHAIGLEILRSQW